jgi:hypothetical protein
LPRLLRQRTERTEVRGTSRRQGAGYLVGSDPPRAAKTRAIPGRHRSRNDRRWKVRDSAFRQELYTVRGVSYPLFRCESSAEASQLEKKAVLQGTAFFVSRPLEAPARQSSRAASASPAMSLILRWRPRPELNRGKRFCRPLRNHSATWPYCRSMAPDVVSRAPFGNAVAIQERTARSNVEGVPTGSHLRRRIRPKAAVMTCRCLPFRPPSRTTRHATHARIQQ